MKCRDCPDYKMCSRVNDLRIMRKKCEKAKWRKSITNYDRIISKTPEELANYLYELTIYGCPDHGARDCVPSCEACWLDWLKQEATDGT